LFTTGSVSGAFKLFRDRSIVEATALSTDEQIVLRVVRYELVTP